MIVELDPEIGHKQICLLSIDQYTTHTFGSDLLIVSISKLSVRVTSQHRESGHLSKWLESKMVGGIQGTHRSGEDHWPIPVLLGSAATFPRCSVNVSPIRYQTGG